MVGEVVAAVNGLLHEYEKPATSERTLAAEWHHV